MEGCGLKALLTVVVPHTVEVCATWSMCVAGSRTSQGSWIDVKHCSWDVAGVYLTTREFATDTYGNVGEFQGHNIM